MSFKQLSLCVALLFVLNRYHEVQAAITSPRELGHLAESPRYFRPAGETSGSSVTSYLKVHDATADQIADIKGAQIQQLPAVEVPHDFAGTVPLVMQGKGAEFQRDYTTQRRWLTFQLDFNPKDKQTELANHYLRELGWDTPYPTRDEPKMVDERLVNEKQEENKTWVQFKPADFPVKLPKDTQHNLLWLRAPMTTKECFEPVGAEQPPAAYGKWMQNLDNYIEFINGHDVFGTNVAMSAEDEEKVAQDLMQVPDSKKLERAINNDIPSGKQAMLWSGRNITRLIAAKYPGRRFVWFRANRSIRSHHLNQIHIFLEKGPEAAEAEMEGLHSGQLAASSSGTGDYLIKP